METYIAVARVSTKKQSKGISPAEQLSRIEFWAKEQNWKQAAPAIDESISGTSFERQGITKTLELIKSKAASLVIFSEPDRLSRDFGQAETFIKDIYINGGKIAFSRDKYICKTESEFMSRYDMELFFAQRERKAIIHRTQGKKLIMFEAGSIVDKLPFGYSAKKEPIKYAGGLYTRKVPEIVISEAMIIKDILENFIRLRSINQTFQYAITKYPNSGKDGNSQMSFTKLRQIIENHGLYAGELQQEFLKYQEQTYTRKIMYPQIIDKGLENSVTATLKLRDKGGLHKTTRPFGRLIYCTCGYKAYFTDSKQKSQPAFKCGSSRYAAQAKKERKNLPNDFKHCKGEIAISKVINEVIEKLSHTLRDYTSSKLELELADSLIITAQLKYEESKTRKEIESLEIKSKRIRDYLLTLDSQLNQTLIFGYEKDSIELSLQIEEKLENLVSLSRHLAQEFEVLRFLGIEMEELDKMTQNVSVVFQKDKYGKPTEKIAIEYNSDALNELLIKALKQVEPKVDVLIKLIMASNWDDANVLMASMGLSIVLPFSEYGSKAKLSGLQITLKPLPERMQLVK